MAAAGDRHYDVAIIGGGAAGFFAAAEIAAIGKGTSVAILEKTGKLLSKVRISGGGRCNVTNSCFDNTELVKSYPRGFRELRQVFARFAVADTIRWFRERNVELATEADGRMFPVSDSSETIIDCLASSCAKGGAEILTGCEVFSIEKSDRFLLNTSKGTVIATRLIVCSGGYPKPGGYGFLHRTGHTIVQPVPSLFTFNLRGEPITRALQGISVQDATVTVQPMAKSFRGPVLITHWGLSGPAVLKLSAFAARDFAAAGYAAAVFVNWLGDASAEDAVGMLSIEQAGHPKALVASRPLCGLPKRLWESLCTKAGIPQRPYGEISKQLMRRLAALLTSDVYKMDGKTTFKEEFVTSGGVDLKEIDFRTMESKLCPGLYFAGEVLNIDGITGGFNFQAAWSTAWIAAHSAAGAP